MMENRSAARGAVFPTLVYADVAAAITWLCDAFGFAERFRYGPPEAPAGAQLAVGEGSVMLTGTREGGGSEWWARVPFRPPSPEVVSITIGVRVEDVDAHHARAASRGARILNPPETYAYGERQYTAVDPEGHRWTFSQSVADTAPEDWGGTSAASVTKD